MESIRVVAADLEQRADWYGLRVDIGPLLDRADDLASADTAMSNWPQPADQSADTYDDDEVVSIPALFSRLGE